MLRVQLLLLVGSEHLCAVVQTGSRAGRPGSWQRSLVPPVLPLCLFLTLCPFLLAILVWRLGMRLVNVT